VNKLGLRAERDPGEAAAAMARRFTEQHHARIAAACLDVGPHVLAANARLVALRRAVALVVVAPWIEDARTIGGTHLEDGEEIA
jgi:glutamine synthetase adenylyltransferase